MTTKNCLHPIKLEEAPFQRSQERKLCVNGAATARLSTRALLVYNTVYFIDHKLLCQRHAE